MKYAFTKAELNVPISWTAEVDSVHDYLEQSSGEYVYKTITLSANNTSASVNIFQLTGTVEVMQIFGSIATKTTLANLTAWYFDLYDSTASVPLTKNDGVLSAMAVGTIFYKNAAASVTMAIGNNAAWAMEEAATGVKAFMPFMITQKTWANTYIRFNYTTTDAPINATLRISVRYRPHTAGWVKGTLIAV